MNYRLKIISIIQSYIMYNPVGVSKLSENQKSRLRNGHQVIIKKGTANNYRKKLNLTRKQTKKK